MARYFACYSHDDEMIVKPLIDWWRLVSPVFFDQDCIEPGEEWEERLHSAIRGAEKIFVFWCTHAQKSRWVKREYVLAIKLDRTVVPILMDGTKLPRPLRAYQYRDARGISRHDERYQAVRAPANIAFVQSVKSASVKLTTPDSLRERLGCEQVTADQLVAAWNTDLGARAPAAEEEQDFLRGAATIIL